MFLRGLPGLVLRAAFQTSMVSGSHPYLAPGPSPVTASGGGKVPARWYALTVCGDSLARLATPAIVRYLIIVFDQDCHAKGKGYGSGNCSK